jgi:PIN domain nuclease of toxin-antitoxin system
MGINYLIDTYVLLWWLFNDLELGDNCREIISNPHHNILISSATAWEIATKYRLGKLPEAQPIVEKYPQILSQSRFVELPITLVHSFRAGSLAIAH